ncbi:MAG: 16S rRNA (uracil(1498)-N(3))-methyltransferase [Campylobacterota bacterium]|nr:16S rRNA (uracil(1498)-N(3))-methyltransferase [Campylobacterota bacterium]
MVFTFHDDAGVEHLELKGESFKYLIKVRRHQEGDILALRQGENPEILCHYRVENIDGRRAFLQLEKSEVKVVRASQELHIGWCIIDPKSIEKVLPLLNESGVNKITFITCKRSQKNFRLDFERYERLLDVSSQQCGRCEKMLFDTMSSSEEFLQKYPQTAIFDFGGKNLENTQDIKTILVGCEGGFSKEERELFDTNNLFSLKTPMILRSETAVVAISNILLLYTSH